MKSIKSVMYLQHLLKNNFDGTADCTTCGKHFNTIAASIKIKNHYKVLNP